MLDGNRDPTGMCLRILIPKLLIMLHLHYLLVKVYFTELYEWGLSIINIPETHHNTAEVFQELTRLLAGCVRSNPGTWAAQQPVPAAAQVKSHRLTPIPRKQNLPYNLIVCHKWCSHWYPSTISGRQDKKHAHVHINSSDFTVYLLTLKADLVRASAPIASMCHMILKEEQCPQSGNWPAVCSEIVSPSCQCTRGERCPPNGCRVAPCPCTEHRAALTGSVFREEGLKQVNLYSALGVTPSLWLQIAVLNWDHYFALSYFHPKVL